jgi:ABC-type antimicrobial peptide transport system permease subunit
VGNELIIVAIILAVVWIGILILRVPAFVAFFSLLVGQVLATELSLNISGFKYSQAVLLVLPLAITLFLLRKRVPKSKLMMEFLPSLCVAVALMLFLYPTVDVLKTSLDIVTSDKIADYRSWILIISSVIVFVSAVMNYPKSDEGKKHR